MKVGRKMMRSLSRREKMSNARSPRGVCSTTIGTRPIGDLLFINSLRTAGRCSARAVLQLELCLDLRVGDQELEGHAIANPLAKPLEVATFLHHTTEGRCGPLTCLRDLLDLGVDVSISGGDRLFVGDGLQQEGAAHQIGRASCRE